MNARRIPWLGLVALVLLAIAAAGVVQLSPEAITIPAAMAIYLLSGTAGMASSLPGGIGVNEAATVQLLGEQGVPAGIALPVAVLRWLITLWSMVALAAAIGVVPLPAGLQLRRDF